MESKKEKFRRNLLDLADSGKFIPGIYNYCDRWCERCTLSDKCLTFAHEQEMKGECNDPETNKLDNVKFWEQIRLSFEVTLDMISEDAKNMGLDFEELPNFVEPENFVSPVEEMAGEYAQSMCKWLEDNFEKLNDKATQLMTIYNKREPAVKLIDALEILQWYCFQISAKINRSFFDLDGRMEENTDEYDMLADNKGSAKVAIIAINHSLEALTILYPEMQNKEDEILNFMAQLSNIKKLILVTFPTAMDFKRPGFDD